MSETFAAKAVGHAGKVLGSKQGPSIEGLQRWCDEHHPNAWSCTIRGESTSDGTYQGVGKGRVVSSRERGQWHRENPAGIVYAVVYWRQDGRYSLDEAVKVYKRESAAEKYAMDPRRRGENLVVRTFKEATGEQTFIRHNPGPIPGDRENPEQAMNKYTPTKKELVDALAYLDRNFRDIESNPITTEMWAEGLALGIPGNAEPWMEEAVDQMYSQLTKAQWEGVGARAFTIAAEHDIFGWGVRGEGQSMVDRPSRASAAGWGDIKANPAGGEVAALVNSIRAAAAREGLDLSACTSSRDAHSLLSSTAKGREFLSHASAKGGVSNLEALQWIAEVPGEHWLARKNPAGGEVAAMPPGSKIAGGASYDVLSIWGDRMAAVEAPYYDASSPEDFDPATQSFRYKVYLSDIPADPKLLGQRIDFPYGNKLITEQLFHYRPLHGMGTHRGQLQPPFDAWVPRKLKDLSPRQRSIVHQMLERQGYVEPRKYKLKKAQWKKLLAARTFAETQEMDADLANAADELVMVAGKDRYEYSIYKGLDPRDEEDAEKIWSRIPGIALTDAKGVLKDYMERPGARKNPYGSFARGGDYRRSGLTAKGKRMEEAIAETQGPGIGHATVYAAAQRGVPGLVKKKWAEEHGYPKPNPGFSPGWGEPKQQWVFRTKEEAQAFKSALQADRSIRLQGTVTARKALPEYKGGGSPGWTVQFQGLGLMDTSAAVGLARSMDGRKWGAAKNPYEIHFDGEKIATTADTTAFLRDVLDIEASEARRLAAEMKKIEDLGGTAGTRAVLRDIDRAADAHGVEGIFKGKNGEPWRAVHSLAMPLAEYVNTGDTYSPTVLFDYREGKFYLTTYGDWVERYERERG